MFNLKVLYSLLSGYPFAYEGGEVTAVDLTTNTVTIGERVYNVGPGTPNVSVGDEVKPFQILCDGIEINDWVTDPTLIESLADELTEKRLILNLENSLQFPHSLELIEAFRKNSIPAGIRLIETG